MVTNISFEAECMISVKDDLLFLNKNKKPNPESTKNTSKQHEWPISKPNI
jgi:hypothetical protein